MNLQILLHNYNYIILQFFYRFVNAENQLFIIKSNVKTMNCALISHSGTVIIGIKFKKSDEIIVIEIPSKQTVLGTE